MGNGSFKQPPEGPKIGPEKKPSELPDSKRDELGDLGKLVSEPAKLDSRVAAAEEQPAIEDLPAAEGSDNGEEGVARVEALQHVLEDMPEPEPDPETAALEEAAEPTIEERQEFIRCMLGNKPYTKSFELFGGAVLLKMVDLTPAETDTLFRHLAADQRSGVIETVDDWNTELDRYRMFWMTHELTWGGETKYPHKEAEECGANKPRGALNSFMLSFTGTVQYRAILHTTRIFQRHLDKLVRGALDPDFWEAGGPSSQSEPTSEEPSTTEESPG